MTIIIITVLPGASWLLQTYKPNTEYVVLNKTKLINRNKSTTTRRFSEVCVNIIGVSVFTLLLLRVIALVTAQSTSSTCDNGR